MRGCRFEWGSASFECLVRQRRTIPIKSTSPGLPAAMFRCSSAARANLRCSGEVNQWLDGVYCVPLAWPCVAVLALPPFSQYVGKFGLWLGLLKAAKGTKRRPTGKRIEAMTPQTYPSSTAVFLHGESDFKLRDGEKIGCCCEGLQPRDSPSERTSEGTLGIGDKNDNEVRRRFCFDRCTKKTTHRCRRSPSL